MRRGYWTGFIVGGLVGMVVAKAYGDRLMDMVLPGMTGEGGDEDNAETSGMDSYRPRGRRD